MDATLHYPAKVRDVRLQSRRHAEQAYSEDDPQRTVGSR